MFPNIQPSTKNAQSLIYAFLVRTFIGKLEQETHPHTEELVIYALNDASKGTLRYGWNKFTILQWMSKFTILRNSYSEIRDSSAFS